MSLHLRAERLTLRPWTDSDADDYVALISERGDGTPTVEDARRRISQQLAATEQTGITLLPICRLAEGDSSGTAG